MTKIQVRLAVLVMVSVSLLLGFAVGGVSAKKGSSGGSEFKASDFSGVYTFRMVPATSFAPFLAGSGVDTAPRQDILRVGVLTSDGAGNLTGRTIATTDDGLTTVVIDFTWTGTYIINADGTGSMSINPADDGVIISCKDGDGVDVLGCDAFEGPETYALVVNQHGDDKLVSFIQTDNVGGGAKIFLTGEAKRR